MEKKFYESFLNTFPPFWQQTAPNATVTTRLRQTFPRDHKLIKRTLLTVLIPDPIAQYLSNFHPARAPPPPFVKFFITPARFKSQKMKNFNPKRVILMFKHNPGAAGDSFIQKKKLFLTKWRASLTLKWTGNKRSYRHFLCKSPTSNNRKQAIQKLHYILCTFSSYLFMFPMDSFLFL